MWMHVFSCQSMIQKHLRADGQEYKQYILDICQQRNDTLGDGTNCWSLSCPSILCVSHMTKFGYLDTQQPSMSHKTITKSGSGCLIVASSNTAYMTISMLKYHHPTARRVSTVLPWSWHKFDHLADAVLVRWTAAEYPNSRTSSCEQYTEYLDNSKINSLFRDMGTPNDTCRSVGSEHTSREGGPLSDHIWI